VNWCFASRRIGKPAETDIAFAPSTEQQRMPYVNQSSNVPILRVSINGYDAGRLLKASIYEFRYERPDVDQPSVALAMPARERRIWRDGAIFAAIDQHLPEGDLLLRLSAMLPKQQLQPIHLLAKVREGGIGQLGYAAPGAAPAPMPIHMERQELLSLPFSRKLFDELADAYLQTGAGIAGVQPKVMLADRPGASIPTVILKVAPPEYPGLVANEFLCLSAAKLAGMMTPGFELSHDGHMLVIDRFDLIANMHGGLDRLGFEDIASLMGLRVRDALADRKYQGSYQRVAELLLALQLPAEDLHQFFEQVALSVMVRNGDAHLKNFGVLVPHGGPPRISPVFDVVSTAVYTYTRFVGDTEQTDRTMALKLFAGRRSTKAYPTTDELLRFGAEVCGVTRPQAVLDQIAHAMQRVLTDARGDARIPASLLARMAPLWRAGMQYASTVPAASLGTVNAAHTLLSTFFNIAQRWELAPEEQALLLGVSQTTCDRWRNGQVSGLLTGETLERLSYILNIYAALQILLPYQRRADAWLRQPNTASPFDGEPAISRMLGGSVLDLKSVADYLDAAQVGDFS
jgi:serine/threonine-protein kinase HipA